MIAMIFRALCLTVLGAMVLSSCLASIVASYIASKERRDRRRVRQVQPPPPAPIKCKLCLQETVESWSFGDDHGPYHQECAIVVVEVRAMYRSRSKAAS